MLFHFVLFNLQYIRQSPRLQSEKRSTKANLREELKRRKYAVVLVTIQVFLLSATNVH